MDSSLLPNIYDFIAHTYPFSMLSTLEQDTLAAAVKIAYYAKDDEICDEALSGVGLFMLRTGCAEQINRDGSLRARLSVGDSFGYTQLNKHGPSDYKVVFLENSLVYIISRQILEFIKARNEHVGRYFDCHEYVRLTSARHYLLDGDGYLNSRLKQRVDSVSQKRVVCVPPTCTLQECARRLLFTGTEIAMVTTPDTAELIGVVTKSDLALRALASGLPYSSPVSAIMSPHPVVIDESKPLYQVLESMLYHHVQNLPVMHGKQVVGSVNTRDLLQNSLLQPLYLLKAISKQISISDLSTLASQKQEIFVTLMELKVEPAVIQRTFTRIADAFAKKICQLVEKSLGTPPCNYAFFAAGSLAREEVHFLSDQDNGLVYEHELPAGELTYFKVFTHKVCTALDACGYTWCSGNYMACKAQWCQSSQGWERYYDKWMLEPDAQALLDSSVFFDLRCLYGDEFLVTKLKQKIITNAANSSRFLALLCHNALAVSPPLGLFRQFVLTRDGENKPALNLKHQGINLIVELARLYALQKRSLCVNTAERLEQSLDDAASARELIEALNFLNDVRFEHQYQALMHHEKISNLLSPDELSQFERSHLKDAFRIISRGQSAAQVHFTKGVL